MKWKKMCDLLVRTAILAETHQINDEFKLTPRVKMMLSNGYFRRLLTDKLLVAKKNILGHSADGVTRLYLQLGLEKYAVAKLRSRYWNLKASAMQEIGLMGLTIQLPQIYRYTNNKKELVRDEAQLTIIKLFGFDGLRFLDIISYQLTGWQQIRLLHELSLVESENFSAIDKWLQSENKSVVIFAIKLAATYRRFELYNDVALHLENIDEEIRLEAITCMKKWEAADAKELLMNLFPQEIPKNQLAIATAFQTICTNVDIPKLISFLDTENNRLKYLLIKAIACIDVETIKVLKNSFSPAETDVLMIINQVEGEIIK
ncbi:hypothetical protein EZJ43_10645 [Pedobacter changchengzhani]|uniref:HEAT repeat domain-containing protein n=1 Tax=Pedobacter changchengzhani TaxID=2529274 RepID=A0A4R5MLZ0_9SPHI|nr:hypothetical protein [Pedobacter changchengzhani]TDG36129.1 hypothetical protein EZJ43_10645 [Pedobacter changchengzhani]